MILFVNVKEIIDVIPIGRKDIWCKDIVIFNDMNKNGIQSKTSSVVRGTYRIITILYWQCACILQSVQLIFCRA